MNNNENENYHESGNKVGFSSVMLIIFGFALLLGPTFLPSTTLPTLSGILISSLGAILLIIGAILFLLTKLYIKTPSNKVFVRTGMGGKKVVIDGGTIFIPMFHEKMEILTETMKITVSRLGEEALLTKDMLRADVKAEFYIKVEKKEEHILAAATSLGIKGMNPENLKILIEDKLISALRSVAAQSDLEDLNVDRQGFAEKVQKLVEKDLTPNGLTLETTTCSKLDQADYKNINTSNVFDAQGARTVAEKTNTAIIAKNDIEKKAQVEIANRNFETTQQLNEIKIKEELSTAERSKKVLILQATNEAEARSGQAEQDRLAQVAEISSQEAVAVREQEKEKAVKTASVVKDQAIEVANLTKLQTIAVQEQVKDQAVQTATVEKEKAVLTKNQEKAVVEKAKAEAEGEATKANQAVITIKSVAEADRAKQVTIKNQEAVAETTKINRNVETDIASYQTKTIAAANKDAAENNAAAVTIAADAGFKQKELEAKGLTALQMVPVNVSKAQVEVNAQQVEVTGKELKYKAEFSQVSITLETNLAGIEAQKEVGKAFAEAMGTAFSKANLNIWGDGNTAKDMMSMFSQGQGKYIQLKALTDGGNANNPVREEAKELVKDYISGLKTAMEVTGVAENISTEVKALVTEFVQSGGGNAMVGMGILVKFLTGKDASKEDIKKLEDLVASLKK